LRILYGKKYKKSQTTELEYAFFLFYRVIFQTSHI